VRVLVLGHKGMLGNDVMQLFADCDLHGLDIDEVDITNYDDLNEKVTAISPEVIINCAAYTNVDGCETNRETAFDANAEGVKNIGKICRDNNIKLVHISTDYVFNGGKGSPYREDDETEPLSVYGESKLAGEEYLNELLDDHIIARTEWLYGKNGKNFVTTMLSLSENHDRLTVVNDQFGSPTYTKDLASIIKVMVDKSLSGTYHVSNSGDTTWHGFAKRIFELTGNNIPVDEVSSDKFIRPAKRPAYSVFDLTKLHSDTGSEMPNWEDALKRYLKEINLI